MATLKKKVKFVQKNQNYKKRLGQISKVKWHEMTGIKLVKIATIFYVVILMLYQLNENERLIQLS